MLENITKSQSELKNAISEMQSTLEGINSRLDETEEQTGELEDRIVVITQSEEQKGKKEF